MKRTRVKICGITRVEDARAAIEAGADALGFVFYPPSPRALSAEQASAIVSQLSPFVSSVALFVNPTRDEVERVCSLCRIDLLQFHGDEDESFCASFSRPYIKALRVREGVDVEAQLAPYASARGILLDTYKKGVPGGTGESFNWTLVPDVQVPIILAGGLDDSNVARAISQVRPYAVDVSGGVEAEPGKKQYNKITAFMNEVYSV